MEEYATICWLVGWFGGFFLSTDWAGWGPVWVLYGRWWALGVSNSSKEPLDPPTSSPCVSLPREDREQEVSLVLPSLSHAGLVPLTCGPIQAPGQRLSVTVSLCFIVSAIADETNADGGGQQQCAGSYWCCLATAVGLGYDFKMSI